jgi:hypothetical protein
VERGDEPVEGGALDSPGDGGREAGGLQEEPVESGAPDDEPDAAA